MVEVKNTQDLLNLKPGGLITRENLTDLIMGSKQAESSYWSRNELVINNTPQQGINWICPPEKPKFKSYHKITSVILRAINDQTHNDAWLDENTFSYAFRKDNKKNKQVNLQNTPNMVLKQQKRFKYGMYLFINDPADDHNLLLAGVFDVIECWDNLPDPHVILKRR